MRNANKNSRKEVSAVTFQEFALNFKLYKIILVDVHKLYAGVKRLHSVSFVLHCSYKVTSGAIIRDGDRKRGVHASPCVVPKKLFLEKIAPPFTS